MENYELLLQNYGDKFNKYQIDKKDLKEYCLSNMESLIYLNTKNNNHHLESTFLDNNNGVIHKAFIDRQLYIRPCDKKDIFINKEEQNFSISIGHVFKKVAVQDGMFTIEIYDPKDKSINLKIYHSDAIDQMERYEMSYDCVDYIEVDLNNYGIRPGKEYDIYEFNNKILIDEKDGKKIIGEHFLGDREQKLNMYKDYAELFNKEEYSVGIRSGGCRLK